MKYIDDLANYSRRQTLEFDIHVYAIGGKNYIRLQSMTNTDTQDIEQTANQIIRISENGADYVRVTTPTTKDVDALKEIKRIIKKIAIETPLIADVHFSPKVAMYALEVADKIRINPGNLINSRRFDDEQEELKKVREVFIPIIEKAKKYGKAIRVGTNVGSLSERILNKYGATAEGLVEATMEYLDICKEQEFDNVVVSIKASNALLNIQANRLLVARMKEKGYAYPVHLGVTEAGSGVEGRVKSAVGIGALLVDGIGNTVRVSLTEPPENEIPVARKIVRYAVSRAKQQKLPELKEMFFSPYSYQPREVKSEVLPGYPVVIADYRNSLPQKDSAFKPDYALVTDETAGAVANKGIIPLREGAANEYALLKPSEIDEFEGKLGFVYAGLDDVNNAGFVEKIRYKNNLVLIFEPSTDNFIGELRHFIYSLEKKNCKIPVVIKLDYKDIFFEDLIIKASVDSGVFFVDGLVNGLWISSSCEEAKNVELAYEILQASGRRISKAEFISCPGCGRTTFDLEPVTEKIKKRFSDRKGLKIAIMGCIVNGLGEMADADYAYVGTGKGKISLYYNRKLVKKDIPEADALDELEALIINTQAKNGLS